MYEGGGGDAAQNPAGDLHHCFPIRSLIQDYGTYERQCYSNSEDSEETGPNHVFCPTANTSHLQEAFSLDAIRKV